MASTHRIALLLVLGLSSCMKAERLGTDTNSPGGFLIGNFAASETTVTGSGSGADGPSGLPPSLAAAHPTLADGAVYINVHFSGLYFDFDAPLDATSQPAVQVHFWNGSQWEAGTDLDIHTSIAGSRLTVQTGLLFFPENAKVRVTVEGSGLRSSSGAAATSNFSTEFLTNKIGPRVLTTASGRLQADGSSGVVIDNTTQVRWMKCPLGTAADCTGSPATYTQAQAMGACTTLNRMNAGSGYAGRTNWRLPSIEDLESLPDFERTQPLIPADRFPNAQNASVWSMSAVGPTHTEAWAMNLYTGEVKRYARTTTLSVRCMSDEGGYAPYSSGSNTGGAYAVTEDGLGVSYVALDLFPGHYFMVCPLGHANEYIGFYRCLGSQTVLENHTSRVNACSGVSGRSAATIDQLLLLLRRDRPYSEYRHPDFAGVTGEESVWSSTTSGPNDAYLVNFATGEILLRPRTDLNAIRCLRTLPPF